MIRKFLHGQRQPLVDVLVSVVVSVFLMAGFGVWYTQHQLDLMGRKFCKLVSLSDDAYKQPLPPGIPTTPTRQKLASANHKLRGDLHCDANR
jgi:hypothetical protein